MGNTASTDTAPDSPPKEDEETKPEEDPFTWPANLFLELRDMAEVSSLIYSFAYLLHAGRKKDGDAIADTAEAEARAIMSDLDALREVVDEDCTILKRKFTPAQVLKILMDHKEFLTDNPDFPASPDVMVQSLLNLQARVPDLQPDALTLADYDDIFQTAEFVYAIGKDDVNKRITVLFRGTDNELAFSTNWSTNANVLKTKLLIPEHVQQSLKLGINRVWIHSGFYNYVFDKTKTTKDQEATTKYSQVLNALKLTMAEYPGYKVYLTGHSLGAALSTLFAYLFTCEQDLPKPISCINFASPRVGDYNFLAACDAMQKQGILRLCRMVNDNDLITAIPTLNYVHVGFQIKIFRDPADSKAQVSYPKLVDSYYSKFLRAWDNSIVLTTDTKYDHAISDYRRRVMENQVDLAALDLNKLYRDSALTGF